RRLKAVFLDRLGDDAGGIGFGFGDDALGLGVLLGGIKIAVGGKFNRALAAFGLGHLGAAGAFGVQLLKHGGARRLVQVHIEDLGAGYFDAPVIDDIGHILADRLDQGGA